MRRVISKEDCKIDHYEPVVVVCPECGFEICYG